MILLASLIIAASASTSRPVQVQVQSPAGRVSNQEVEIYTLSRDQTSEPVKGKTNKAGIAVIAVPGSGEEQIIARTLYENLQYFSDVSLLSEAQKKPLQIEVYKTSTDASPIKIQDFRVMISVSREVLTIHQSIMIQNSGTSTYVGKTNPEEVEVWRIRLPRNSHELRFSSGFREEDTRIDGNDLVSARPLTPGLSEYAFEYQVERQTRSADLGFEVSLPIEALSLGLDDDGARPQTPGLVAEGKKVYKNQFIRLWSADLKDQKSFSISLTNLKWKYRDSHLVALVAFILLLIVGFAVLRKPESNASLENKEELLRELVLLEKMKASKLVTEDEYWKKRLGYLKRIHVFYRNPRS